MPALITHVCIRPPLPEGLVGFLEVERFEETSEDSSLPRTLLYRIMNNQSLVLVTPLRGRSPFLEPMSPRAQQIIEAGEREGQQRCAALVGHRVCRSMMEGRGIDTHQGDTPRRIRLVVKGTGEDDIPLGSLARGGPCGSQRMVELGGVGMRVDVRAIPVGEILGHPERYNSSNHWSGSVNGDVDASPLHYAASNTPAPPDDYAATVDSFDARHWIGTFLPHATRVTIPRKHVEWLWCAFQMGSFRGAPPAQYEDELQALAELLTPELTQAAEAAGADLATGIFVRTDRTSLKTGVHGVGPYRSALEILQSLVTCRLGHHAFDRGDSHITLYVTPFLKLRRDREFRVFVSDRRVTGISQQFIHQPNTWLREMRRQGGDRALQDLVRQMVAHVEEQIVPAAGALGGGGINSFVLDLVVLETHHIPHIVFEQHSFRFIELNPFGKRYTSGSACFHWIDDEALLEGCRARRATASAVLPEPTGRRAMTGTDVGSPLQLRFVDIETPLRFTPWHLTHPTPLFETL